MDKEKETETLWKKYTCLLYWLIQENDIQLLFFNVLNHYTLVL